MAKNLRAVVTVQKAQVTANYVKDEAVTSYQKAEAVASRTDFSLNQWFYEDYTEVASSHTGILLAELYVTLVNKNLSETLTLSEASALDFNKPTTETLSLLESFAKAVQFQRSFTDAFTLDDAASIDKDYYGNKGNVAFMLDVIGLSTAKIATETVTVGDVYTAVVNKDNFQTDVIVVTNEGNLVGIEAIKNFYMNYLNGFSDIEFTILDAFGQGERIVKHWNFKGTHTGDFFGIPATGNKLDLSGTTLVTMKDGKIAKEQDFFDMQSLILQLQKPSEEEVVVDDYTGI